MTGRVDGGEHSTEQEQMIEQESTGMHHDRSYQGSENKILGVADQRQCTPWYYLRPECKHF